MTHHFGQTTESGMALFMLNDLKMLSSVVEVLCSYWQWKVASAVLEILFKLLEGYVPKPDDFVDQFVEIQGGERVLVPKPPGFSLMTYMLNDTPMLRMVSEAEFH